MPVLDAPGLKEVLYENKGKREEFPAFSANISLRLIIRAVWRGDGNITFAGPFSIGP